MQVGEEFAGGLPEGRHHPAGGRVRPSIGVVSNCYADVTRLPAASFQLLSNCVAALYSILEALAVTSADTHSAAQFAPKGISRCL
jgi:hypothetical protein